MTGTVTLSIEIELGWGMHDLDRYSHLSDDGIRERAYLRRLLDACDVEDVPISFDVVGHLLLHACSGTHEGPYPKGWFRADPGTDATTDPLFYAPDVAEEVLRSETDHELCTHTFSHVPCNEFDDPTIVHDIELAQEQHVALCGERTTSLVPPRNWEPSLRVCKETGIETLRVAHTATSKTPLHRYASLLAGGPPETDDTRVVDGVTETYTVTHQTLTAPSLPWGQRPAHPCFRPVPVRLRQRLHERSLENALRRTADTDGSLHLWCHLWDLSNPEQWRPLRRFLSTLAAARDAGDVEVVPMCDLGTHVPERARVGASLAEQ